MSLFMLEWEEGGVIVQYTLEMGGGIIVYIGKGGGIVYTGGVRGIAYLGMGRCHCFHWN